MRASPSLRASLHSLHDELDSWQAVADRLGFKSKATPWRVANQGWLPKDPASLQKLGLPALVGVQFVPGSTIESGALIGEGSRSCECGVEFISNHPRRRRCFYCSPIRRSVKHE